MMKPKLFAASAAIALILVGCGSGASDDPATTPENTSESVVNTAESGISESAEASENASALNAFFEEDGINLHWFSFNGFTIFSDCDAYMEL